MWGDGNVLNWIAVMVVQVIHLLKIFKLQTYNEWILWYVNYTLIMLFKNTEENQKII